MGGGGGSGTPYNGPFGEAPPERVFLFKLKVNRRIGISNFELIEMNNLSVFWQVSCARFRKVKSNERNSPLFLPSYITKPMFLLVILKKLRHLVIQSGIKTKLTVTPSYMFISCFVVAMRPCFQP